MSRTTLRWLFAGVALATFFSLPATAAERAQRIELVTHDGVELVGHYHAGTKGTKSPAVLILDGIGDNRRPDMCEAIADRLHADGCATLTFDFRGNGASTAIREEFWDDQTNRKLVRGYRTKDAPTEIKFEDFKPGYYRTLVNDVATMRSFLDRRNDASECNTGNIIVIGLREGAVIGSMWLATEWNRYRIAGGFSPRLVANPEGRDVSGCIWIDPPSVIDRQSISLVDYIKRATAKRSTFVAWMHPQSDERQTRLAGQCNVQINRKSSKIFHPSPVKVERGKQLVDLQNLPGLVEKFVDEMRDNTDPPLWDDRDFNDKRYAWSLPGGRLELAKEEDERTLRSIPIDHLLGK